MASEAHQGISIRVITYNIHKGLHAYSRRFVLHELREVLRTVGADLVFLQEVKGLSHSRKRRGEISEQLEFLADKVWSHYAYGKNAVYSEGHHGNAILSKYPILEVENIDISTNRFERRGVLHAQIGIPGLSRHLHLLCLHLDLLERGRGRQLARLRDRIKTAVPRGAPLLVAGDFNDWRERAGRELAVDLKLDEVGLVAHGRHLRTFPSWLPLLPLDRIYFRGLTMLSSGVLSGERWAKLSDHQALWAEFLLHY